MKTTYTIREGFTVYLEGTPYSGGVTIELTPDQLRSNQHKLEGTNTTVVPIPVGHQIKNDDKSVGRRKIYADTTLYVSLSGSDTGDGSENDPFKTIARSLAEVQEFLDLNGHKITISISAGDYTSEGLLHLPTLTAGLAISCGVVVPDHIPNAQVVIRGIEKETFVEGFELDHASYYSIGEMVLRPKEKALSTARGGILEAFKISVEGIEESIAFVALESSLLKFESLLTIDGSFEKIFEVNDGSIVKLASNLALLSGSSLSINTFLDVKGNSTVNLNTSQFYLDSSSLSTSTSFLEDCYIRVPNHIAGLINYTSSSGCRYGFFNDEPIGILKALSDRVAALESN